MNDTIAQRVCPKCGGLIPAAASQGLCPKCLLAALAAPTETDRPAEPRPPPPSVEAVQAALPHLEVLELVGCGGMGAVYRARQPKLDRTVALKLLMPPLASEAAFAERFSREARVLARLHHPGVVSVFDYGEAGGFFYLLMEFVDGVNLRQAMQAGRFTPAQALALVPKICEALQFAHDEGILHRDIKPENILLDVRGRVKIADFGIAKLLGDKAQAAPLTASGLAVGTPHYMAPEQLERPHDVDPRADIYSLGVVFYEMLTGELPIGRFAPPSQKAPVDPRVDQVVLRALEKERERRQHNATAVKTEVEQITATPAAAAGSMWPPAVPAVGPKTSPCYVSTPEYLRTFRGRFLCIYQAKGGLRLDGETLRFHSGWQVMTIPLSSIRGLSQGCFSQAAQPVPLNYIGVTFVEHGVPRVLLFTPARNAPTATPVAPARWYVPVRKNNLVVVAEWMQALQQAIQAATGAAVAVEYAEAPPSVTWGELARIYLLSAAACTAVFALIPLGLLQRLPNHWSELVAGPIVPAATFALLFAARWWQGRRVSRNGNPEPLPGPPPTSGPDARGPFGTQVLPESAPAPVPPERRSVCYFSTPERMRNCFPAPQAHIFQCKGELRLDAGNLVFVSPWQTRVVMPLKDICNLSIGQFQMWTTPWVMKYERLNFLAVTFDAEGGRRTVHLTPVMAGATSTAQTNALVAEWFETIRKAAVTHAGAAPPASEPAAVSVSAQPGWNRKGVPLLAALVASWAWLLLRLSKLSGPTPDVLTILAFVATLLLLVGCIWHSSGFLQANRALTRGDFDAVTCDEPPGSALT